MDDDNATSLYYSNLAAAFVRGKLGLSGQETDTLIRAGLEQGLKLHNFKQMSLPRLHRVLGIIRGIEPQRLLDAGSGRGAFLWPLLDEFPDMRITAIDISIPRIADILSVRRGGYESLNGQVMDVRALGFADNTFDAVTALEVIEHLERPAAACAEIVRVARRFAILSVPSEPDGDPKHIQTFAQKTLRGMLIDAGARSVGIEYVLNHMIAVAKV